MDNKFPENLDENIIVLSKKNNNEQSLLYIVKIFILNLFKYKFSIRKFLASLSFYSHLSKIIFEKIKPIILQSDFETIIIPYESQPFQNYLFKNNNALMQFEKFLEKTHFEAKSGNKLKDGYIIKG